MMYSEYRVANGRQYNHQWLLLRVMPGTLGRYTRLMDEYCSHIEYYYPQYEKEVRPHGSRKVIKVLKPVYPGYVFVKGGMHEVTRLPVRVWWVRFGGVVECVDDRVIECIKEFEGRGELVREVKHVNPYRSGVRVYVHMDVGDLVATVVKLVGGNRALVDLPVGRGLVGIHCLEPV